MTTPAIIEAAMAALTVSLAFDILENPSDDGFGLMTRMRLLAAETLWNWTLSGPEFASAESP